MQSENTRKFNVPAYDEHGNHIANVYGYNDERGVITTDIQPVQKSAGVTRLAIKITYEPEIIGASHE